jgi:hypothetical protein
MWLAVLFIPALVAFAIHLLLLATWQKVATWRVRRHVNHGLMRGDAVSLGKAAAETSEAQRDWPSYKLWQLGKAVEITRQRLEPVA